MEIVRCNVHSVMYKAQASVNEVLELDAIASLSYWGR